MTKKQLIELVKFTAGEIVAPTTLNDEDAESIIDDFVDAEQLTIPIVSVSLPSDPMVLAKYLHDNYEQIAKRTNWQTQKNCKVEFDDLPIENKNTMILLAGKLILDFVGNER